MHVVSSLKLGTVAVLPGPTMPGSDWFKRTVHGRQTHGSMPCNGVDPIVTAAEIVAAWQTIVSRTHNIGNLPAMLSFGVVDGGSRYSIVPDTVELQDHLRTFDPAMHQPALYRLKSIAERVAATHGATVEGQVPLVSNPMLVNDDNVGRGRARRPGARQRRLASARSQAMDGVGRP